MVRCKYLLPNIVWRNVMIPDTKKMVPISSALTTSSATVPTSTHSNELSNSGTVIAPTDIIR